LHGIRHCDARSRLFTGVYCLDATGSLVSLEADRFVSLVTHRIKKAQSDGAKTVTLGGAPFPAFHPGSIAGCSACATVDEDGITVTLYTTEPNAAA
jgi:hypothetical protein